MSNNNYDAFRTFIEGRFGFGGQSMKKEGQKAPSIDDLKEAGSEEEFKARLKEGQAFRLKEKAGFHVISIDENRPPLVQVVGDSDLIAANVGVCNFGDYRKQCEKWSSTRTGRRNVPDRVRKWNSNFEKLAGRENTA